MPTLNWLDKNKTVHTTPKVPTRILRADDSLSYGEADSGNMLIQGDNLHALKALMPYFRGQVKCVFIDPPYNTKSAFEHYQDSLEHSKWLDMMFPRLELLRDLLAENGSIWVTIDDHEAHYLKVMLDEIFGRGNFVANCIWQKKFSPQNDAKWISNSHDNLTCYARHKEKFCVNPLPRSDSMDERYKNPDNDPRGVWTATDLTRAEHRDRDFWGLTTPSGKVVFPAKGRSWSRPKENIERLKQEGQRSEKTVETVKASGGEVGGVGENRTNGKRKKRARRSLARQIIYFTKYARQTQARASGARIY